MGNARASKCGTATMRFLRFSFVKSPTPGIRGNFSDMIRKLLLIIVALVACSTMLPVFAGGFETDYNITGAGVAKQGFYLVKIEVHTKNKNLPDNDLIKAALNGVLFRGFSNAGYGNSQKPLAGDASNEAQHADFYKEFFGKNGAAVNYGSVIDGSRAVVKSGKLYKVSAIVEVSKDALASYLQSSNIINSLNSIF